ncbi:hypothetical protein KBY83_12640 [Cyanobium sp. WKJ7-Wakatipu]|uniref:hypothetical protein n=1 Tax=Cyanobium sp. WKJ7-Wakatipu TaxID=2823726 RepID=UPI0020CEEC43|nr:hypothetical protein [Cyanobium sp. WKJ7-Wakatipu]MCP9784148.1 hypothetical protein [Cyanobium sp. WKJ7-Wakatipu]
MSAFKYEPGQILVEGGRRHEHVNFFRVESRTAAYVATVELEKDFTPSADRRDGFWDGTWLPTDQIHFRSRLGPQRHRITTDAAGNECATPSSTVWDGAPVSCGDG